MGTVGARNAGFESSISDPLTDLEPQFPHLSNNGSCCLECLLRLNRMTYKNDEHTAQQMVTTGSYWLCKLADSAHCLKDSEKDGTG